MARLQQRMHERWAGAGVDRRRSGWAQEEHGMDHDPTGALVAARTDELQFVIRRKSAASAPDGDALEIAAFLGDAEDGEFDDLVQRHRID